MEKKMFHRLLEKASKGSAWEGFEKSLVFANHTFELNGDVITGDYEFFGNYENDLETQKRIIKVINDSFEAINKDECFSLYRYLKEKKIRYARITKTKVRADKNLSKILKEEVCRFSDGSLDCDINDDTGNSKITYVNYEKAEGITQRIQEGDKEVDLTTILDWYQKYYDSIVCSTQTKDSILYFYLIRPSLDNDKLDGMLYFASHRPIIKEALREIARLLSDELVDVLYDKMKKEAVKSAKAAIMSRNMSHNLGSHVMSYLKQHLASVRDAMNNKVLSQVTNSDTDYVKNLEYQELGKFFLSLLESDRISEDLKRQLEEERKSASDKKEETEVINKINFLDNVLSPKKEENLMDACEKIALPFLVGLGKFVSYLQERQDFVATIATAFVPYYSIVNFKDAVYDELNPDKKSERHAKKITNLKTDNILLGTIARSEGLGRSISSTREGKNLNDIVIKYGDFFDGDPVHKDSEAEKELNEMRDINISLPGGVVGRQALFSIVENVIRNAAKHGKWKNKGKLELSFKIYRIDDFNNMNNDAAVEKTDKFGSHLSLYEVIDKFYKTSDDINDVYIVTLTDNLICDEKALAHLREAISEDYVDERAKMREGNKGIKEMKISASWIRDIDDDKNYSRIPQKPEKTNETDEEKFIRLTCDENWVQNENSKKHAPVLYVRIANGHLQYIFCLLIPKKVAIISSQFDNIDVKTQKEFEKFYWGAFSFEQFKNTQNKSFDFILFDSDPISKLDYNELKSITSSRLLRIGDTSNKDRVGYVYGIEKQIANLKNGVLKENEIKDIEEIINVTLADYKKGEVICIEDDNAFGKYEKKDAVLSKDGLKLVHIYDSNPSDKLSEELKENDVYVYRTHHNSEKEFYAYVTNERNDRNKYVEGISGDNSTDKLVRNDTINNIWFYRQLHAMKTKVAIVDERIFSKVCGLEVQDLVSENYPEINDNNLENVKQYYIERPELTEINRQRILSFRNPKLLSEFLKKQFPSYNVTSCETTSYTPTVFMQKGICLFTIVGDVTAEKVFHVYGVKYESNKDIRDRIMKDGKILNQYKSACIKIATIEIEKVDNSNEKIKVTPEKSPLRFDRVSIHQGLLDKLYESFEIKGNASKKEELSKALFKFFSESNPILISPKDEVKHYFLPGMSIHSGRSKPGENDMPQRLPFIQYASIEHAVFDCKYSLVELLDNARYE